MEDRAPTPPAASHCWMLLAVISLGMAAVAAVLLVAARTPVLGALVPTLSFPRALVVHVNLATLVWYFCMAAALWTEALPPGRKALAGGLAAIAACGVIGVVASALVAPGEPVLANYIPYLTHPVFLTALAAVSLTAPLSAALGFPKPRDAAEFGFMVARGPFAMAALYLALAAKDNFPLVEIIWGVGHILQFGFVTLMMSIWLRLALLCGVTAPVGSRWLLAAAALPSVIAPLALATGVMDGSELHPFHTVLMRWLNWPAVVLLAALLLIRGRAVTTIPCLLPSVAMFAAGIAAGAAIGSQTTMIPAHYHGTIGAFTLALMASVMARLELLGLGSKAARRVPWPLRAYAAGSLLLMAGLAWSGLQGAPRKSGFVSDGADLGMTLAASLTGLGGVVTVTGVAFFALLATPRILRLCRNSLTSPHAGAPTFAAAH